MTTFYHYTCDHGRQSIGASGELLPAFMLTDKKIPWTGFVVWLTDLERPERDALGLTSNFISCDRTAHRYRVTDSREVMRWSLYARLLTREQREVVEATPGAMPAHWFVSVAGVPAVYDPLPSRVGMAPDA